MWFYFLRVHRDEDMAGWFENASAQYFLKGCNAVYGVL